MRKIPTLFRRDPEDMARVLREVHPDCQWVLDGVGKATRKYDGTCVGCFPVVLGELRISGSIGSSEVNESGDLSAAWVARREVKAGKTSPPGFIHEETDPATGKTVGWEPIEQSPFIKAFREATEGADLIGDWYFGTYELCGPKVQGNPERYEKHTLIRHRDADVITDAPRDFDGLMDWLMKQGSAIEGIVWTDGLGRMAKLKVRDAEATCKAMR